MMEVQDRKKSIYNFARLKLSSLRAQPSFWALVDQGAVSGGSFLTSITIARLASMSVYGRFSLYLAAIIFLNSVHSALIIYPLSVTIARESSLERQHSVLACALLFTGIAASILSLLSLAFLSGRVGPQLIAMGGLALLAWQVQEACRRALMATLNISGAIFGDIISYPGQAILIYSIYRFQHQLTLGTVLASMAFTSLAAAAVQLTQLKASFKVKHIVANAKGFWNLGSWGVGGAMLSVTSSQAFLGILGWRFGPPSAASLQALINVVGLTHPVLIGISNAVVPHVAKANATGTPRHAGAIGVRMGTHGALFAFPCLLFVMLMPSFTLRFFYGAHSPYILLSTPLRMICLAYLFLYVATVFGSILNGLNHPRLSFNAYVRSSMLSIAVGLPLAAFYGVAGATTGMLIAFGGRVISQSLSLKKVLGALRPEVEERFI